MTAENNSEVKSKKKSKKLIIILSVILAIILIFISAFFIFLKIGESKLRGNTGDISPSLPALEDEVVPEDADAYYNGEAYNYNSELINILLLGIDRKSSDSSKLHQADALYLISIDTKSNKVNIISISRNTLVDVDVYGINGSFIGKQNEQICLSYTYSSDDKKASENTANSVSRLLYGIPINGYYTIFMNSVEEIVDSVGGVPVTITEDLTSISSAMKPGNTVTITGKNALKYLRYRGESNAPRVARQKAFVSSFVSKTKSAYLKDLSLPIKMYNKLASNTVTNVTAASATYLASEAMECEFKFLDIEGTYGSDGKYETFMPDENQLYNLILNTFYIKQK
ncbi:MAG: LCP family protein [Clostridia bacterium]|nr:LCP family protein [Clostridia bacterium]